MDNLQLDALQSECTIFFQENPYAFETVHGLSLRLGRDSNDLQVILNQLVECSFLKVIGTGKNAIYHYIQPTIDTDNQLLDQL